ncbi:MAG: DNA helicase [Verrucomicrobia bacterium]|nr:DNA helicase [Verrucomicrobiota bacterium]
MNSRDILLKRLEQDLVGPLDPAEVIESNPSDRYLTGILFPRGARISPEDDDNGTAVSMDKMEPSSEQSNQHHSGGAGRPTSMGLSFETLVSDQAKPGELLVLTTGARYRKDPTQGWARSPLSLNIKIPLIIQSPIEQTIPLTYAQPGNTDLEGLEFYMRKLKTPQGTLAINLVLRNQSKFKVRDDTQNTENALFQASFCVTGGVNTRIVPRKSITAGESEDDQTASLIYRNNPEYASGQTCSAAWDANTPSQVSVRTEWLPRKITPSISPSGDAVFDKARKDGGLDVSQLGTCDEKELNNLLSAFCDCYESWIHKTEPEITGLPAELVSTANRHKSQWQETLRRMRQGVTLLASDSNARTSFQASQRAMLLQSTWGGEEAAKKPRKMEWRPFQLAFQLIVIPGLVKKDSPERSLLDLLWFPTGGGKTEAYLALIAFLLFFRRLHYGEEIGSGVAVIMRYTLRVLTTQQFERAARMICACELIRINDFPALKKNFSVGLWIGKDSTPNSVIDAQRNEAAAMVLRECPACGEPLVPTKEHNAFSIRCLEQGCALKGRIPVWTVDEDIYREKPSLVIATIDKFAQIPRTPNIRNLFGLGLPHQSPDLIIQDELHLISGPLGTTAGLYEFAVDLFCSKEDIRPKVIGSTATIRNAEEQCNGLFHRKVFQFPAPGIDAENSGFSVAIPLDKKDGRLYVGLSTVGRSAKFTLQSATASLLQANEELSPIEKDHYYTLVAYFNAMRELGGAQVMMVDDVPKAMSIFSNDRPGEKIRSSLDIQEMTSRLQQHEIPKLLAALKKPAGKGSVDILLCTNMISVGVDIQRLSLMVINGQPKATAEYIQASSRVGRSDVPGLVLTIYNNAKPRDRSVYESFFAFHACLYRGVEPTSVTPFAPRARDKALKPVWVATVRNLLVGMDANPMFATTRRHSPEVDKLIEVFRRRAEDIDYEESVSAVNDAKAALDEWSQWTAVRDYWKDSSNQSLLKSAEYLAARRAAGLQTGHTWSAPNSMRDVEPSVDFFLKD